MLSKFKFVPTFLIVFSLYYVSVSGQEKDSPGRLNNEFSVSTSSLALSNLSLRYYRAIGQRFWFKVGLINISGGYHHTEPVNMLTYKSKDIYFSTGIAVGFEKRIYMTDRFEMTFGMDLLMMYNYINHYTDNPSLSPDLKNNKDIKYSSGIGFVLGGYYHFGEHFSLGFELNPKVLYFSENYKDPLNNNSYKTTGFDYSLTNNNILLGVKYIW
jgi:hypothetical protein